MRYFTLIILLVLSCCSRKIEDPLITQVHVRSMQTKTFVGYDAKTVTKEIISVLQDEGFMLKNLSGDLGVITAERDSNIEKFGSKFWAYVFSGKRARWKKQSVIEVTMNITEEQGKTKVRINYLVRILDNLGRLVDVHQVYDEPIYTDFFNKVQRGLLIK